MTNIPAPATHALVTAQLTAAGEQLQGALDARIRAIRMGRAAGLTWAACGAPLGLTGSACYYILERADGGK